MRSEKELRQHVVDTVLAQAARSEERRGEALQEFLGVAVPEVSVAQTERLASLVPPLMPALNRKWAAMFVDRLFETVPDNQIRHLCDGSVENNAALLLVYIMFLESERMEKQMAEDLRAAGLAASGDDLGADAAADYIRARLTALSKKVRGCH